MHVTIDSMSRLRFENVCDPEHPLKLYPTVIEATLSSDEIVKVMGAP
jgi:hypothetical protein